jgi:hypothetical protein
VNGVKRNGVVEKIDTYDTSKLLVEVMQTIYYLKWTNLETFKHPIYKRTDVVTADLPVACYKAAVHREGP